MANHHRLLTTLQSFLQKDRYQGFYWIHVVGEPGSGKSYLLHQAASWPLPEHRKMLKFNWMLFQKGVPATLGKFLRWVFREYPEGFSAFLKSVPPPYARTMRRVLIDEEGKNSAVFSREAEQEHVFFYMLPFVFRGREWVVLLDDVDDAVTETTTLWTSFIRMLRTLPVVLITTGRKAGGFAAEGKPDRLLHIPGLSIKESEQVIRKVGSTHPINARLINNLLYLKSRGNPRMLLYLFEAYFREPLSRCPGRVLPPEVLQTVRPKPELQAAFTRLLDVLPPAAVRLLAFLSRLYDPLPENVGLRLFSVDARTREWIPRLVALGMLQKDALAGDTLLWIPDPAWNAFLRRHTDGEGITDALFRIREWSRTGKWNREVQISHIFLEVEDLETAVELALQEARRFREMGQLERARDRYAFVRRNLHRTPRVSIAGHQVLLEMGQLQQRLGLYDNAFDAFREARETAPREDTAFYFRATLEMAATLLKMDAYAEARYLIREVKFQKIADGPTRALATLLQGDLEFFLGHREYALRQYLAALEIMEREKVATMWESLFLRLRGMHSDRKPDGWITLLRRLRTALPPGEALWFPMAFEEVKSYFARCHYPAALPLAREMYRRTRSRFSPFWKARTHQILADIYAYFGKWRLAAGHLQAIVRSAVLDQRPEWLSRVWLQVAVVFKETGRYGEALQALNRTRQLAGESRFIRGEYEARMHLGHIQLLVHNDMSARTELLDVSRWAENQYELELLVPVTLFLAMYEMHQNHPDRVQQYLQKAARLLEEKATVFDRLNYLYYSILFALQQNDLEKAKREIPEFVQTGETIPKFRILGQYLSGWLARLEGDTARALSLLKPAFQQAWACDMPHLVLHIFRELGPIMRVTEGRQSVKNGMRQAEEAYQRLLNRIQDPILRRQMEESSEMEFFQRLQAEIDRSHE